MRPLQAIASPSSVHRPTPASTMRFGEGHHLEFIPVGFTEDLFSSSKRYDLGTEGLRQKLYQAVEMLFARRGILAKVSAVPYLPEPFLMTDEKAPHATIYEDLRGLAEKELYNPPMSQEDGSAKRPALEDLRFFVEDLARRSPYTKRIFYHIPSKAGDLPPEPRISKVESSEEDINLRKAAWVEMWLSQ